MGKYTDIYDFLHPGCTSYTLVKDDRSGKRKKKASRIDHILVSPCLTKICQDVKHKYTGSLSDHNAIILTLDWCKTPKGPGTFRAGVGIQNDPIYKEAISHLIKHSIASYISDEQLKKSIISLLDSRQKTADEITQLIPGSENDEVKKYALLEAQSRLQILDLTMPMNNSILLFVGTVKSKICSLLCASKRAYFLTSSFSEPGINFSISSAVFFLESRSVSMLFFICSSEM